MTKLNNEKNKLKTISLEEFEEYHREVMEAFETMINSMQNRFGDKFSPDEQADLR